MSARLKVSTTILAGAVTAALASTAFAARSSARSHPSLNVKASMDRVSTRSRNAPSGELPKRDAEKPIRPGAREPEEGRAAELTHSGRSCPAPICEPGLAAMHAASLRPASYGEKACPGSSHPFGTGGQLPAGLKERL